jgi:hypothetical protein
MLGESHIEIKQSTKYIYMLVFHMNRNLGVNLGLDTYMYCNQGKNENVFMVSNCKCKDLEEADSP